MKIAIPLHQGRFCSHFGGAEEFAFYAVDPTSSAVADRHLDTPPEHGRGIYPMWLRKKGATVVLAGGMGPRAIEILARHGIEVVLGVEGDDPDAMARDYLSGGLATTGAVCHDHGFHNCGGHQGGRFGQGGRGQMGR